MSKWPKYKLAEFLVVGDCEPRSLFRRVRQVMAAPRRLALRESARATFARTWPSTSGELESVLDFYPAEWILHSVWVREDTGKFVGTIWRRKIGEKHYFVSIGYGDRAERIWWQHLVHEKPDFPDWIGSGNSEPRLVEAVERVNADLLARNAPFAPPVRPLPPRDTAGGEGTGTSDTETTDPEGGGNE